MLVFGSHPFLLLGYGGGGGGGCVLAQGMVDPGEVASATVKREFGEEALSALTMGEDEAAQVRRDLDRLFDPSTATVVYKYVHVFVVCMCCVVLCCAVLFVVCVCVCVCVLFVCAYCLCVRTVCCVHVCVCPCCHRFVCACLQGLR